MSQKKQLPERVFSDRLPLHLPLCEASHAPHNDSSSDEDEVVEGKLSL
jgi:hypothetical protein